MVIYGPSEFEQGFLKKLHELVAWLIEQHGPDHGIKKIVVSKELWIHLNGRSSYYVEGEIKIEKES